MIRFFIALAFFFFSSIAIAADASMPEMLGLSGDFMAKLLAWMVGLQLIFAGVGKGLTEIAVKTDNTFDNKLANFLSKAAWWVGKAVSYFGMGAPKQVVLEKAEQLKAKGKD